MKILMEILKKTPLFRNMEEVACWDNKLDVPAIGKWIKKDNGNTEYFETNCRLGDLQNPSVLARYFRKIDGNSVGNDSVANVLGVLVERRYVTGSDKWYVGSRYTTGFRSTSYVMKSTHMAPRPKYFAVNNTNRRNSNVVWFDFYGSAGPVLEYLGYEGSLERWDIKWADSGDVNNWLRYTDDNGYSYVFYLHTSTGTTNLVYLYCVTGDCTISGNSGAQYYMSFKDGPQRMSAQGGWFINSPC